MFGRTLRRCGKLSSNSVRAGDGNWSQGVKEKREGQQPGFGKTVVYSLWTSGRTLRGQFPER